MTGRTLTSAVDTELGQSTTAPRWLVKMEFDPLDGTNELRLWNGLGDLTAFGKPFLDFDGTTLDYVIAPGMSGLSSDAVTIEFWMKSDGIDVKQAAPFSYAVDAQDNEIICLNYNNFRIYMGGSSTSTGVDLNDGDWHHLAVTLEKSGVVWNLIVYKDSVEEFNGTITVDHELVGGGTVVLGQEQDSVGGGFEDSQAFLGQMTEVRIWNDVRTSTEISDNFEVRLVGDEAGLVMYWRLNEGSGTAADDLSGTGNDGTINGTSWETSLEGPLGEIYTGAGRLMQIEPIQETQETVASGVRMSISIQPTSDQPDAVDAILNIALGEEYQGRPVTIWQAQIDHTDGSLIADPFARFSGKMDVMEDSELPGAAVITITAENRLIDLERSRRRTYTPEDQMASHSGDTFFDDVVTLQNREIKLENQSEIK